MTNALPQHPRGRRVDVLHLCPETPQHRPGIHCALCLVIPSARQEAHYVSTERLARWQAEQNQRLRADGVPA